ncbi:hypothetical protein MQX03_07530 [Chryseobacterium aahli]|uniref:hypothetical protein n=1 Tax=Chryseobacterium aahli TaxID=1278643 RepID=UPI001F5FFD07|nr:hypothetical protein [Chryseobacterium aahli]MCI3937046.1 hypothetical protein [Chryseobacterium aahli]
MIKKYLFIAFAIISISVVSCRQDEDLPVTELKFIELQSKDIVEKKTSKKSDSISYSKSSDSTDTGITPSDPPKNGTHWRLNDSIKIIDVTDPPKNSTHWKGQN